MSDLNKLKERYAAPDVPDCRICGSKLSLQSTGGGKADVWACDGLERNESGFFSKPGRSIADDHYERSRWTDYLRGGDCEVIEVIDQLESAQQRVVDLKASFDELAAAVGWTPAQGEQSGESPMDVAHALRLLACELEAEIARRDKAAGEPVGEVVEWKHPTEERHVDFRWLRYVPAGTKLFAAAPPAPRATNAWIKCSDRMPVQRQSNRYVALNLLLNERTVAQGGFDDGEFWIEGVVVNNVTHWMPLPVAPQQ